MAKKIVSQGISTKEFTFKLECLEGKVDQIERKVSNKADEVVSLQVLEHRRELEEIYQVINNIDQHIKQIENELSRVEAYQEQLNIAHQEQTSRNHRKGKKANKKVTPLFS